MMHYLFLIHTASAEPRPAAALLFGPETVLQILPVQRIMLALCGTHIA